MKYMGAAEFKAKCLKVMEEVAASGEEVVVTKRGTPVVRIVPPPTAAAEAHGLGWGACAHLAVPGGSDLPDPVVDPSDWTYDWNNLDPDGGQRASDGQSGE